MVRGGLLLSLWVVLGVGQCLLLFHVQGRLGQPLDQEGGGSELGLGQDAQQVPKVLANARQSSLISCVSRPTGRRFPGRRVAACHGPCWRGSLPPS